MALSFSISDLLVIPALALAILQGASFATLHRSRISLLMSLFFFFLAGFLALNLNSAFNFPNVVYFLLFTMAILIPAVLWLLTFSLFSDEDHIPGIYVTILVGYIVLQTAGTILEIWSSVALQESTTLYMMVILLPQTVMCALALHSIYLAAKGYYSDLIETRRTARVVFVVCVAIVILLVLGNGLLESVGYLTAGNDAQAVELFPEPMIATYILLLMICMHLFTYKLRDDVDLLVNLPASKSCTSNDTVESLATPLDTEEKLARTIIDVMTQERLYREEKYTLAQFASHLHVPEHRLRHIINKRMRYRNFNQFLNKFRVREAVESLSNHDKPISSIAYEVGFSTLSVFNRAFKENTGKTPSEYRNAE